MVSLELHHFRMIAHLFQQFLGHSTRYVLLRSFWRLFTIKIFPFSCLKLIMIFFSPKKSNYQQDVAKWLQSMDNGCVIRTKNDETSKVVGFLGMSVGCPDKIHLCWKKCSTDTLVHEGTKSQVKVFKKLLFDKVST